MFRGGRRDDLLDIRSMDVSNSLLARLYQRAEVDETGMSVPFDDVIGMPSDVVRIALDSLADSSHVIVEGG